MGHLRLKVVWISCNTTEMGALFSYTFPKQKASQTKNTYEKTKKIRERPNIMQGQRPEKEVTFWPGLLIKYEIRAASLTKNDELDTDNRVKRRKMHKK